MDSVFRVSLVLDMVDNMTSKVSGAAKGISGPLQKLDNTFGTMQKAGTAMMGVGTAITTAALATVTSTFDTQDALGELASLGVEDLGAIEKAAKNFSDTWAGTTKADFISASYDIKSGIASLSDEGVAQFTELAALTAKATKSTAGEMTSLFATGYGIYKNYYSDLSDLEFGEMFSAGIATAVKNYKTSGSGMADAIKMLGASATNANVPMEEQLAILGQLQATMSGSEAGTKYKAFLNSAASAGEKLGLNFLDTNNQLMSMPDILETLRGKYGDTIDALEKRELKEAFGTDEAIALVDLLYNNTDQLKTGINDLHSSMDQGTESTEAMAKAINDTPAGKFQVLKQELHNAAEELGQGLLPVVNQGLEVATAAVKKASDWVSEHQATVSMIMRIVFAVGLFLIVAGAATAIIGTVGKALTGFKTALNIARTATGGLSGALLSSPFTWVIAAVVAMIALFKLCGGDVEALGGIFETVFGAVKTVIGNVLTGIAEHLPEFLQFGLDLITYIVTGIAQNLPGLITAGIGMIQSILTGLIQLLPQIGAAGVTLLNLLVNAIVTGLPAMLAAGIELVKMIVTGLAQMLPQLLAAGITMLTQLLTGILQNLPRLMQAGMTMVSMLVQGAATLLPTIVQTGIQMLLMLLSGILQNLPQLLQTGITLLTMFIQGVAQNLPTLLQTGISLIVMILQGILTAIPRIIVAAIQLIPMLAQGIASNAGTLISTGISLIGKLLTGIITAIPAVVSMIPGLFGQIWDAIKSIDWIGLGGDLVSSIGEGFISGFSSLVDSVKGLWDDFVGWFTGSSEDMEAYNAADIVGYTQTMDGRYTNDNGMNYYTAQELADQGVAGAAEVVAMQQGTVPAPTAETTPAAAPAETAATQTVEATTSVQTDPAAMQAQGQELINGLIAGVEGAAPAAEGAAQQSAADIMAQYGIDANNPAGAADALVADLTAGIEGAAPGAAASAEDAATDIMSKFNMDGSDVTADGLMSGLMDSITGGGAEAQGAAEQASSDILGAFNMDSSAATAAGTDLMSGMAQAITDGTAGASEAASAANSAIMDAISTDTTGAQTAASDMLTNVASGITANAASAESAATAASSTIMDALATDTSAATTAGTDMITELTAGITAGAGEASAAATETATGIMESLETGTSTATADGTKVMTDVASGISSGSSQVTGAARTAATGAMNAWRSATAGAASLGSSFMSQVASGIRSGGSAAVGAAQSIASQVRSAFANMQVTVPAPRLPHVSVSFATVGSGDAKATVPQFSTAYYAKGGIMDGPTLFGLNGSQAMVGGEAGPEAILPLDTLWTRMRSIIAELLGGRGRKDEKGQEAAHGIMQSVAQRLAGTPRASRADKDEKRENTRKEGGKGMVIQKLEMNVDISSMDDMHKLRKLIEQIEGNNDPAYA